jgi:WD40 repeat protein
MVDALIRIITLPLRFILGFDTFISYSRADATEHAEALASELAHRHIRHRIDMQEARPCERVTFYLSVSIVLSKVLVVLCTPASITSTHVEDEIEIFQKWSAGPIVLLELSAPPEKAVWWPLVQGLARIKREGGVQSALAPIASRIVNSVGYWRVTRAQSMISALFVLVLLTSAYFYYRVDSLRRTAERDLTAAKVETTAETAEAQKQAGIAAENKLAALGEQAKADQAAKDAERANKEAASAGRLKDQNIGAALILHSRTVAPDESPWAAAPLPPDSLPQMTRLAQLSARDPEAYYTHLYVEALNRTNNSEALSALAIEAPLMRTLAATLVLPMTVHVLQPEGNIFRVLGSDGSSYWVRPGSQGWVMQQENGPQQLLPEWVTSEVEHVRAESPRSPGPQSSQRFLYPRLEPLVERTSPDGNLVASPRDEGGVKLSNKSKKTVMFFPTDRLVVAISFSPDQSTLAALDNRKIVRLWDLSTNLEVGRFFAGDSYDAHTDFYGHGGGEPGDRNVYHLAFSADGKYLLSSADESAIHLWKLDSADLTFTRQWITLLEISPDGRLLAVLTKSETELEDPGPGAIHILDARSLRESIILKETSGVTRWLGFSPNSRFVVGEDRTGLKFWGTRTGKLWDSVEETGVQNVVWSEGSDKVAIETGSHIRIRDVQRRIPLPTIPDPAGDTYPFPTRSPGHFNFDGSEYVRTTHGTVCSWRAANGKQLQPCGTVDVLLGDHRDEALKAGMISDVSRNLGFVLLTSGSNTSVFSRKTGRITPLPETSHASFSPSGNQVLGFTGPGRAGRPREIILWKASDGFRTPVKLDHHPFDREVRPIPAQISDFHWSGDERRLTTRLNSTILWDTDSGEVVADLAGHQFLLSPNGRVFYSSDYINYLLPDRCSNRCSESLCRSDYELCGERRPVTKFVQEYLLDRGELQHYVCEKLTMTMPEKSWKDLDLGEPYRDPCAMHRTNLATTPNAR